MRVRHRKYLLLGVLLVSAGAGAEDGKGGGVQQFPRPPIRSLPKKTPEPPAPPPPQNLPLFPEVPVASGLGSSSAHFAMALGWQRLWSEPVGNARNDIWPAPTVIAARGSLIAVASLGKPGETDALDGVHIIDGRAREGSHRVRIIPSPASSKPGGTDAVGALLDGDFVIFATYGGAIAKRRLDGLEAWTVTPLPDKARPSLPLLVDLNGDQVRDVVVPTLPASPFSVPRSAVAVALDGKTGRTLWTADVPPLRACTFTHVSVNLDARTLAVACSSSDTGETVDLGFDGKLLGGSMGGSEGDRGTVSAPRAVGLAEPRERNYSLPMARDLIAVDAEGRAGSYPLSKLETPATIADVDGDNVWDVLVVADGALYALKTGATGDADRTTWLTDHSPESNKIDTPQAYNSRYQRRDQERWLKPSHDADDDAFSKPAAAAGQTLPLLVRDTSHAVPVSNGKYPVTAIVECGARYGLNEGSLVMSTGADWARVPGAPWPLTALGCGSGTATMLGERTPVLVLETANRQIVRMELPRSWAVLLASVGGLALFALLLALFFNRRQQSVLDDPGKIPPKVRKVVMSDAPLSNRAQADSAQHQLLDGLIAMLDNRDTRSPVTIALYGPWGSGKSSMMQLLRSELRDTGRYIDVWFNAWRYHREKELSAPLLQAMVNEVGKRTDPLTRMAVLWDRIRTASIRQIMLSLAPPLALGLICLLAYRLFLAKYSTAITSGTTLISGVALLAGAVYRVASPLFKVFSLDPSKLLNADDSKGRMNFVREFPAEFERITKQMPSGTRLILFIDDLDRCPPDRIVDVLETISMLADTGCGFFVLAIDPTTIRRAIELKYKEVLRLARTEGAPDAEGYGLRYLEKIVTLGVNVPKIRPESIRPETRLEKGPDQVPFWKWLVTRVLPEPPLLLAATFLALVATLGAYNYATLTRVMDDCGRLMFPELTAEAEKANASPNRAPPSGSALGISAPTPADVKSAATVTPNPTPAPSTSDRPLSPSSPPGERRVVERPPEVTASIDATAPSPSDRLLVDRWLRGLALAVVGLLALALGVISWGEWKRRRTIATARPIGKDSPEFEAALQSSKQQLDVTPREVIRFTNASRFLFEVVSAAPNAPGSERQAWDADFFRLMLARWMKAPDPVSPVWMKSQMDVWLPTLRTTIDNTAASRQGNAADTTPTAASSKGK